MIRRVRRALLPHLREARRAIKERLSSLRRRSQRWRTSRPQESRDRTTRRRMRTPTPTLHLRKLRKRLLRADVERLNRMRRQRRRQLLNHSHSNRPTRRPVRRRSVDRDREATTPKASRRCCRKTSESSPKQRLPIRLRKQVMPQRAEMQTTTSKHQHSRRTQRKRLSSNSNSSLRTPVVHTKHTSNTPTQVRA